MTAGSEDYKTAETVDATAAPSRPTPEQEVAMVNAFIVAKRKAAKALEQGYNITGPLAVAVAPGAGAGGAASGGKAPDRTSEDGKDKQPQQQVMSLADFSGTNVAEAAAALSPGEVTSVMAEIEEEQLSDAKALVSALNPVVLEAFEVTADTLTTALTAEARRRARLRTLFEVRRSRSSIDLTAYGPSTIEDDETLALIDGDSSGLGCSLLVGRKLRLNDEPWRKVVREVSKLPAFLGEDDFTPRYLTMRAEIADNPPTLSAPACVRYYYVYPPVVFACICACRRGAVPAGGGGQCDVRRGDGAAGARMCAAEGGGGA